jgi:hypothetical protein
MFDDLDATLKALLDDPGAPPDVQAADVSFDTPGRGFQPGQPTLNLFLHDVTENRELRDEARVMTVSPDGGTFTARMPSLRVDCSYLITAWSAKSGGQQAAEEHRLLGLTLRWLSRFPVIDPGFLRGVLAAPPQPFPLATMVAQTREGRSNAEFWTALGIAPRPAFTTVVTMTVDPYDRTEEFPEVRELHIDTTLI